MKKRICGLMAIVLIMTLLTGCSSRVAEHTNTYFSQMENVITTSRNAKEAEQAALAAESSKTPVPVAENALAAPANFVVNEDGSYSFDAVEGAEYYYVYVYANASTQDATAQSEQIPENGSASYSGNVNDICNFSYATWNIRVAAYPDFSTGKVASPEVKASYTVKGAVEYGEPGFDYMWTLTSHTLTVKVKDMEYDRTAYPTEITVTLTNKADANDVISITVNDIDSDYILASTTSAKEDAEYSVKADFKWDENYVTNPEFSLSGGEAATSSTENMISGEFYYSSSIFKAFNFPHVQKDFNPVEGGLAGMWYNDGSESSGGCASCETEEDEDEDKNCYFEATPIDAVDGAQYSYTIHVTCPAGDMTATPRLSPGSATTKHIFGYMNIYADGTFTMEIEYQYISTDMMNAAVHYVPNVICDGVYTVNADGTLNLSYDHENAHEGVYDILTERTGQIVEYYELNPDEDPNASTAQGNEASSGEGEGEQSSGEGEPAEGEASSGEGAPAEGEQSSGEGAPAEGEQSSEGAPAEGENAA